MGCVSIDRPKALLHSMEKEEATQEDFNRLSAAEQDWLLMLPLRPRSEWARFFKGTRRELESLIINSLKP